MVINTTKTAGRVLKEIALIVARLLVGLILIVGRKVRADGKPKVTQLASWVKARSIIFIRKSIEVVKPLAIEAGQKSKALLIVTGRRLRTEGGPRAMYTAHFIKLHSIAFVRKRKEQQTTKSTLKILFMILLDKIITPAPQHRKFLRKSYSKKIVHLMSVTDWQTKLRIKASPVI